MALTRETMLVRNGDFLYGSVGADEALVMNIVDDSYFGFNAVAKRIWEMLDSPKTVAALCAEICAEFDVDAQTCETEVLRFAGDLIARGMLRDHGA